MASPSVKTQLLWLLPFWALALTVAHLDGQTGVTGFLLSIVYGALAGFGSVAARRTWERHHG